MFCLFFLLPPLRGLYPSAVQSSPSPKAPEAYAPLQRLWLRGGLTKLLQGPAAQASPERFPQIYGERQVGWLVVTVTIKLHTEILVSAYVYMCVCINGPYLYCVYVPLDVA